MSMIITIGREFGSGGRELGKRIAEELGIAYYDKEILVEIAKKTDLAYDYVKQIIENKPIVYYPITIGHTLNVYNDNGFYSESLSMNHNSIYAEQANVIKELASKSDCVIVGRCADYILKDYKPFRIFVYSDMESKIKRCREKNEAEADLPDKKLKKYIKKIDKQRKKYYEFYTSQEWGSMLNYDICVNTSNKSIKEVVHNIITIFKENK